MSALRRNLLSKGPKRFTLGNKECGPVKWTSYFEEERFIKTDSGNFHIFIKGNKGPILLCLHGGGYCGLTWSLFAEEIFDKIECQIWAIDLRGHGQTTTAQDEDLSLETLSNDVCNVISSIYSENVPPIVLIGHSMGGAVAVEAAAYLDGVVAVCVIDVVEGTALESLSSMQSVLRGRPSSFKSVEHAIQWSFRGGQTHNLEAARVSMPGQIKNQKTGELAAAEPEKIENEINTEILTTDKTLSHRIEHEKPENTIEEEDEEETATTSDAESINISTFSKPPLPNRTSGDFYNPNNIAPSYVWRIDLSKTEHFWSGWFKGLSQKFLDIPLPKILLLANIHGLDTMLTVGQMQGKFQLQVLPKSGHAIHEDQPHQVADVVAGFLVKQKLTVAKNDFTPIMPAC